MTSDIDERVGYTNESLRMLESEEGQLNAIFACFGSAAQHSQFFEAALGEFLVVYNKIFRKSLTLNDLEAIETRLGKKTMGALLQEFRKYVTIDNSQIEQYLDDALVKRNFLMHHFFRVRQEEFMTENGRMRMLKELVHIESELKRAMALINGMRVAVSEALNSKDGNEDIETADRRAAGEALFSIKIHWPE